MKDNLKFLENNKQDLVKFLRNRIPMFHNSNLFFRDIHYGIKNFFEMKQKHISYSEGEKLAQEFITQLEKEGVLKKVNKLGWVLNNPEFATPKKDKQAA